MKRPFSSPPSDPPPPDKKMKNKLVEVEEFGLDDDLLFEVLKHADARTLAVASCVSRQWHRTSQDERLWEMICTRSWSNSGSYAPHQLRSVVLALGGFRRLHSLSFRPLLRGGGGGGGSSSSPNSVMDDQFPPPRMMVPKWGKDEVNLSLSLLSISYYERMILDSSKKRLLASSGVILHSPLQQQQQPFPPKI